MPFHIQPEITLINTKSVILQKENKMHVRHRIKLGALAAAGSTAALVLAGVPALASDQASARSVTGPEVISGADLHGQAAVANIPIVTVTMQGMVRAHGTVRLVSNTPRHTFVTSAGNLVVQRNSHVHATSTQTENAKTCWYTFTSDGVFNAAGSESTGAFAGASGPGAVHIYFGAFQPRYTSGKDKGRCNGNANPLAKGAVESFLASVVLTIKQ
jgi:hypothetical protein